MLNDFQFQAYINVDHSLIQEAKSYLSTVRNSDPSRMVGVNAEDNLCSWVMSKKMGHTVSLESRTAEKAFFILSEYDERIIEYWDQPEPIKIERTNKNGRKAACWHTPDALLLTKDGPKVVEVKSEDEIKELLQKNPVDWERGADGTVTFAPAKKAFAKIGLCHEVFVYRASLRYKVANLELMMRSRAVPRYLSSQLASTRWVFSEQFYYSLYDLRDKLKDYDYTGLIQMVDDGHLVVDLDKTLLSSPKGCVVTLDQALLPEALRLHHDRKLYTDGMLSNSHLSKVPSLKHASRALASLERIESGEKSRSVNRWLAKIRRGAALGLTPFQSLIPQYYLSGNRTPRLPIDVREYLTEFLLGDYANSQGLPVYRGHKKYCELAKEVHPGHDPVSRRTYYKMLQQLPPEDIATKRGGKRAANAVKEPSDPDKRALKAQCAWQIAAADHYEADIFVIIFDSDGYSYVVRPYVTALIDLYSKSVIGLSVSLKAPSRRSLARVMRDCVRRHGRLPAEIAVDRGSDFKSVYFASLLADLEITLTQRPTANPKYGSEIERLFGEFKQTWLSQRPGNITDYKEVRSVDRKEAPDKRATIRPYDFYRELQRYVEWRDSKQRGISNESASAALARSTKAYPFIGRETSLDNDFMVATSVDSAMYKVDFQRGLHIGDMYYWSPELATLRGKKKRVEARLDAENPHVVYAQVGQGWIPCYSSQINTYSALDPVSQFVAGLELVDAVKEKRAIREQADSELVHIIREMDDIARSGQGVPVAEVDVSPEREANIFEQLRHCTVTPLTTECWGR